MGGIQVCSGDSPHWAETKLQAVLTSASLKAELCSTPGYQHTQVTISLEKQRRETLVSYNFLFLILIVIHWVLLGLDRSASILGKIEGQTLLALLQSTSIPCREKLSGSGASGLEDTRLQLRNQAVKQPHVHLCFPSHCRGLCSPP